jgi:hypothetical protein
MGDKPLVEYKVEYARRIHDEATWTLYRVNAARQWNGIADYTSKDAAEGAASILNALSQHETVHLFAPRREIAE